MLAATSVGGKINRLLRSVSDVGAEILDGIDLDLFRETLDSGADLLPIDGAGEPAEPEAPLLQPENTGEEIIFSPAIYPYREMLSSEGKKLYNQIYANAMALNEEFQLAVSTQTEEIDEIVSAVLFDHAELFWVDYKFEYAYLEDGSVISLTLFFNETAENLELNQRRFEQAAQTVLQEAVKLPTVLEKERFVHDYLLDHVEYDLDAALNQSAYSALVNGSSVCAGYARAFQYLMIELGVPCYYCVGDAGGSHAWNIIELDEDYYHVDVSWDDPIDNPVGSYYYNYFNLTDAEMLNSHSRTSLSSYLPTCDGPHLSKENSVTPNSNPPTTDEADGFFCENILTSQKPSNPDNSASRLPSL